MIGELVETERIEVSPYTPFKILSREIMGAIPLKGPYASHQDPSYSERPDLFCLMNIDEADRALDTLRERPT